MLNALWKRIEKWPGTPTLAINRRRSPFDSKYIDTMNLLERELRHLAAENVVLQVDAKPAAFRNNILRSINDVDGPAVIVSFRHGADGQDYAYPCDTFDKLQDNLRAIALALEALRKVDRYGVTRRGEQYQGFRALPPPAQQTPKMTPEQASTWISDQLNGAVTAAAIFAFRDLFDMAFKLASRRLHPDAGGSHDSFVRLQEAAAVMTEHFKAQAKGAAK